MMALAISTGFLSGGSTAGLIALISRSLAQGINSSPNSLAWSFVALAIVALTTSIISQFILISLAQQSIFRLRLSLSRQILATDLADLEKLGASRLLASLTDDIQAVADAVRLIPFLCIDLAIVAGCLLYIIWLSWQVFFLVFLLMILALSSCQWLLHRGRKYLARAREEQDRLFADFRAISDGTKELKLSYQRREAFLTEDLEPAAATSRYYNTRGLTMFAATSSWGKLIFFFAVGFVLFALPKLVTLNLQTLSGYVLTFTYLMLPMENLIASLPVLGRAGVAIDKIESLNLSLTNSVKPTAAPPVAQAQWQELKLKQVTYTYHIEQEDRQFVLGPIDLTLHPGEIVFIVGGNGSGKSTLAKLILGLYAPESGAIYWNGQPLDADDAQQSEAYRQQFSAIFTDFYLFDRLIGLNDPQLQTQLEAQAQAYLRQLQLDHKVTLEQGKFSTTALSQGQRKRLALLLAYLEDRPIYLFDEWAADQDPEFKHLFYTQLLPQLRDQGKTILVISHDDHYFHLGDRLIKLNYGQIEYTQE